MAKKRRYKKTKTRASKIDVAVISLIILSILLAVLIYTKSGVVGNKLNEIGECLWYLNPFKPNCSTTFPSNGSGTFHTRLGKHCFYRPTSKYSQT